MDEWIINGPRAMLSNGFTVGRESSYRERNNRRTRRRLNGNFALRDNAGKFINGGANLRRLLYDHNLPEYQNTLCLEVGEVYQTLLMVEVTIVRRLTEDHLDYAQGFRFMAADERLYTSEGNRHPRRKKLTDLVCVLGDYWLKPNHISPVITVKLDRP